MKLTIPAFGEQRFSDHRENAASRVVLMENADSGAFDAYASLLEENGYRRMEAYAVAEGVDFNTLSADELNAVWDKIKHRN